MPKERTLKVDVDAKVALLQALAANDEWLAVVEVANELQTIALKEHDKEYRALLEQNRALLAAQGQG